jgi:putative peptide zinc metalloprotease protein
MAPLRRGAAALLIVFVLGLCLGATPAWAQTADGGSTGNDNTAIAINTKDGSSIFKFAFGITKATGDVVDGGNAAVAYASCTDCQTVAVAIQFVIVQGSPDTFTPENVAIAINESCTLCDTMALAYQVVIQTDGPMRLTDEGRRRLNELLQTLRELEKDDLAIDEIHDRVEDLFHQMVDVMATELVAVSQPAEVAAAAAASSTTTTTTVQDLATTTSTTQVVRSSTTTTPSGSTTTTTGSAPTSSTSTSTSTTTSTTAR